MRTSNVLSIVCGGLLLAFASQASSSTGSPFYGDAPDEHHPWAIHDQNRPQPKVVAPGTFSTLAQPGKPPSDAIILFDGTDLSKWESDNAEGTPTKWIVNGGAMECVPKSGYIRTKEKFGDCQLHVEWAAPKNVVGDSQGRGNSGIFLMGKVEVQVLDIYNNPSYADGMAGSVYGVNPPLVNPLQPPGEFQVVDIVFRRPIWKDGKELDPGYVTVFINGVLVQDHTRLEGGTGHMRRTKPNDLGAVGPLKFQDHGNPVRYRNVWYRPLPPRAIEGGTDGYLTPEATLAKRAELAKSIREDAAKNAEPLGQMLRLAESLVYEKDEATLKKVEEMASACIAEIKAKDKKDDAKRVLGAFNYLAKNNIVPATFAPKAAVDALIKEKGWEDKKK